MPDFDYSKFQQANGQEPSEGPQTISTNPKTDFDYSKFSDTAEQAQAQPEQDSFGGAAMAFIKNFNNSIDQVATGIIAPLFPQRAIEQSRAFKRSAAEESAKQYPWSAALGNLAANIGMTAPLAVATGGLGAARNIAVTADAGAALGFAANPEEGSRTQNAIIGGVGGAVGGAIGSAVQGIAKALPLNKIATFASQGGKNTDAETAANKLGVELSPFETTEAINLRRAPLEKIGMNPDRAAELDAALSTREAKLLQVFDEIKQSVTPDGESSKIYEVLKPRQISEEFTNKIIPLSDSKNLTYAQRLYKDAHEALNFEGIKPGSFDDLLKVKKHIDDKINTLNTAMGSAMKKGKSSGSKSAQEIDLLGVKSKLNEAMLSVSSPEELPLAKKFIAQQSVLDKMDYAINSIKLKKAGQKTPAITQIFNKLASTKGSTKELIADITHANGDVEKVKNFVEVMRAIQDSPLDKLVGKNQFASSMPLKEAAEAGVAGMVTDPTIGGGVFASKVGGKMLSSKRYFDQIWKPVPELNATPGQTAKQVISGGGILTGQEVSN